MKLKCITILIAALTLSSCTLLETQRPEPFSADAFKTSRKGVVFFSIAEGEEENFLTFKFEKSLVFHLVKIGDEHKLPYRIAPCQGFISHRLRDYSSDNLLFLDPGVYYIDFIQRMPKPHGYNQILHRWYPSPGLKNTIIQYGAFEVKAG
ncbi:MAG TPA: hypothetical protein DIC42_01100, partial [Holosporales bacterium]|nr:hypothetical protein [Holosporales bacterium]